VLQEVLYAKGYIDAEGTSLTRQAGGQFLDLVRVQLTVIDHADVGGEAPQDTIYAQDKDALRIVADVC
jgi:hypothetical protein